MSKVLIRFFLIIVVFLAGLRIILAQDMAPDTLLYLDGVTIYSARINRFAKGQSFLTPDSLSRSEYPGASLAELISGSTSTFIRNYGQGSLSTLSFRGTSANHTGLLWNGIRVSPPNIGYLDLSLVQQSFFNNITILYGGASPMFGSGSIGGGIHLENRPVFEKTGFNFGQDISAGSFGTLGFESNGTVYRKNFYNRTALSFFNSVNDFKYLDLNGEKVKLQHAAILKSGIIHDMAVQLPGNQYIMGSLWFQYADREIPPTLTQDKSEAVQIDRSWRSMLVWKDFNEKNNLEAKLAYFNEYTRYDDPPASVFSTIKSQSLVGSFESTWEIKKNSALFAGTQFTYEYADLDYYEYPQDQQNLAVFASYRHNFPILKWQASINGRQEFFTDYHSPFLFSIGMEGKIWRFISGRMNVSRNFRAPTLNERFWQPGGNPELNPEESWNEELGIAIEKQFSSSLVNFGLTFYNSNVDNWILWLPGSSYWSVENAQEVWSRGFEISGNQSFAISEVKLLFGESYTYTKATNQVKLFEQDASYKKQLIYTPLHRLMVRVAVVYKGFNLTLKGNFTGIVYTTKDNLDWLPPYFILDAIVSKSFKLKNSDNMVIQFNVNNLSNIEYQSVPYRPMPGIGFLVTVRYFLSQ